jgi:hypothetical protein
MHIATRQFRRRTAARHIIACGDSARPSLPLRRYLQTMPDWFVMIIGTSLLALAISASG